MSLAFQVHVNAHELAAFKRRAVRHYKKTGGEYIEVLFIHRAIAEYHIVGFHKCKIVEAGFGSVQNEDDDWNRLVRLAKSRGLDVGSIHTHPSSFGTQPSKEDYMGVTDDVLIGVCEIYDPQYVPCKHCSPSATKPVSRKCSTTVDFWIPQRPCLVIEIEA